MNEPKLLKQDAVFKGRRFQVRVDRVVEPSGMEASREIVAIDNAVCVVARPGPDAVILIRQYRHAAGETLLEIPAGAIETGEDPRDAAIRELEEETGYRAEKMVERGGFWTTPGFTTEYMYLYEATGLTKTQINPDDDESIETDIVTSGEALRMIEDGRIRDAKSIIGLLKVLTR